ncbi:MAG: hypothetical protein ABIE94_00720 [archaeon]
MITTAILQNIIAFTLMILFVVFMNIQGHYYVKLIFFLRVKYPKLYKEFIWGNWLERLYFEKPFFRYSFFIWSNRENNPEIYELKRRIRLFQALGWLCPVALIAILLVFF